MLYLELTDRYVDDLYKDENSFQGLSNESQFNVWYSKMEQ